MCTTGLVSLIIDEAQVRRDMRRICEAAGYRVQYHTDGQAYLAAIESVLDPDEATGTPSRTRCLILELAASDRLELLEEVAGGASPLVRQPVIVVASRLTSTAVVQAMRRGAMDVFGYPLEQRRLLRRLQEAMALAERAETLRQRVRQYQVSLRNLTQRERQTLDGLLRGWSNKRIAYHMAVSEKTVTSHRASLLRKMEAEHLVELVRLVTEVSLVIDTGVHDDERARVNKA